MRKRAAQKMTKDRRPPGADRAPGAAEGHELSPKATHFLRRALEGYKPYVPGEQPPDGEDWVKLNTNESPLPPSPRVVEAIREAADASLRLYPSPSAAPARIAIAKHLGLQPDQVTLGNGGDELIEMCFRAFGGRSLISALDSVKDSYNLDRLAIVAAKAAIEDEDHHRRIVSAVIEGRDFLIQELTAMKFDLVPPAANFVFTKPPANADHVA